MANEESEQKMSKAKNSDFDSNDPFKNFALSDSGLLPPPPIVRVEGWQHFVTKSMVMKPSMPLPEEFANWTKVRKKDFNKSRKKYHSEMPLVETPTMKLIHDDSIRLAVTNYNAAPGARQGVILDGLGTVGKSSIASELGKKYELAWRKNILPRLGNSIPMPIPVVYVTLPGDIAIEDFNRLITSFMGISVPQSARAAYLTGRIIDAVQACATSLIIVDDIHFLQMRYKTAQSVNNHLKSLASSLSATFIYAGINVEGSGLLMEGQSKDKAFASQTQHRFKNYSITPFKKRASDLKLLLKTFEQNLALMNHEAGTLEKMATYIHNRTGGFMGPISCLIREGANMAIDTGVEYITMDILSKIKLDYASEEYYETMKSKK